MLKTICGKLGFDENSVSCFEEAYEKIFSLKEAVDYFESAKNLMFSGDEGFVGYLESIAECTGVNRYTSDMVFWLLCGYKLYDIYRDAGYPEELCTDCLRDLKYKNDECLKMYGIPGVFTHWFGDFYTLKRFAFGRLEYDISEWKHGDYKGMLDDGDPAFSCHIPSCGPLYPDAVMDSLKKLYTFFNDELKGGILAVRCCSWLLYPPLLEFCAENSNMRKFYEMFDVIEVNDREGQYPDLWRVFYKEYEGPGTLAKLPEGTGFQRIAKKFFMDGGQMGVGLGVILFDGEQIINL